MIENYFFILFIFYLKNIQLRLDYQKFDVLFPYFKHKIQILRHNFSQIRVINYLLLKQIDAQQA